MSANRFPPQPGSNDPALTSASVPIMTLTPGQVFGSRYRVERLIGAGGMGAVYQVWDQELDVRVALKVIRAEITANVETARDFERRFKQELVLARQVTHPNVVRIHDLGETSGIKYITMPYIQGVDLATLLKEGRLAFDRALRIAQQLASGLAAAHDVGVMHRDLKPQNVLIGESDRVYLVDFGLAKSLESSAVQLTRTGEFFGTPRYISPEQVEGKAPDHRSDLYALGLIFYEMVTGEAPFGGPSPYQLMYQRVQERPKDPKTLNPELPDYFNRVVMRCLERHPVARYETAGEIVADLESGRASSASRVSRLTAMANALPSLTRQGKMVWVAAALSILTVSAVLVYRAMLADVEPEASRTLESIVPSPSQRKLVAVLPFRVIGDQAALGHVASGVNEALSTKLFQMDNISVAGAAAVERASKERSLDRIARTLGVNLLVGGTVQGSADGSLRIIVHLEDVVGGKRLWSQEFSGVVGDLLTLEDRIFAQLVTALDLRPTAATRERITSRPTENFEAYELYLKGRNAMRAQQDVKNIEAAIAFYEAALKKDPGFALAYAGISDSSVLMYRRTKEKLWIDKAQFAASQAERTDKGRFEVHVALGNLYQATGKADEAIGELKRALELVPNSDEVYRGLGRAYLRLGKGDEAIRAYEQAVVINPYYWLNHNSLGTAHLQLGAYEKAGQAFQRVIELEPENVDGFNNLGGTYLQLGQYREAAASFKKALALLPTAETYTNLGIAYAMVRDFSKAVPMFEKAVELSPNSELWVGNLADGYRWAGQREKAATTYDKAIALAYKELQVNPKNGLTKINLALYYAKKGDDERGRRYAGEALADDSSNVNIIYSQAIVHMLANRRAEALKALEAAFQAGYPVSMAQADPDLAALKNHPTFVELVKRAEGSKK